MIRTHYQKLGIVLFLFSISFHLWAQDVQIQGRILDENNEPIPGASVLIKGTSNGVASDIDGTYRISAPTGSTLVFSFIGYETQEIAVGNRSVIDVSLQLDLSDLDEVVVVGYGTVKKSQLTGAISSVSSREINELPITDARQALQGRAVGVDVTQAGSICSGQYPDCRGADGFQLAGYCFYGSAKRCICHGNIWF